MHKLCDELFQPGQVSEMIIIFNLPKVTEIKVILDLAKVSKLTIIFDQLKVSKITSSRIFISSVTEGLQTSKLRSRCTFLKGFHSALNHRM